MRWSRRQRAKDKALQDQLDVAREKWQDTRRQEGKVNLISDRLRQHYEDNQFAARIFQHIAEGR